MNFDKYVDKFYRIFIPSLIVALVVFIPFWLSHGYDLYIDHSYHDSRPFYCHPNSGLEECI